MADSKNVLCENIAHFRKALGLTQEELGRRVGVSTQAVSKWECGGMPDPMLLPSLADALGASIDALFGRDGSEYRPLEEVLNAELAGTPQEKRLHRIYELCWAMQKSAMCCEKDFGHSVSGIVQAMQLEPEKENSYIPFLRSEEGLQMISISEHRPFYFLLPEPKNGYSSMLPNTGSYERLFEMLARPNRFRVLACLERVERSFTPGYLAAKLHISVEDSREALLDLNAHALCEVGRYDTEAGVQNVFRKRENLNLLPFLVAASTLMNRPMDFLQFHVRTVPMLADDPGAGNPDPVWTPADTNTARTEFNKD